MPALARDGATEAEAVCVAGEPPVDAGRLGVEVERETALEVGEPGARRQVAATGTVGSVELPLVRHAPEPAHDVERDPVASRRRSHAPVGTRRTDLDRVLVDRRDLDRGALTTGVAGDGSRGDLLGAPARRRHASPRGVTVVGALGGGLYDDAVGRLALCIQSRHLFLDAGIGHEEHGDDHEVHVEEAERVHRGDSCLGEKGLRD